MSIYEALQTYDDDIPNELSINIASTFNQSSGEPIIIVNAVWFGPEDEVNNQIQPFLALGPAANATSTVRWTDWWTVANFGAYNRASAIDCVNSQDYTAYALGTRKTDPHTLTKVYTGLATFTKANPGFVGFIGIDRYPNAVTLSIPQGETAYPYRAIKSQVTMQSNFPRNNSTLNELANEFWKDTRSSVQATSGFDHLSVYVNFANGDEGPAAWYSPQNLYNLTRLKRKWDSRERFSFYQPVPLRWP
ncbi:hypothetical protein DV737_g5694, partial [Chaetothyriales sp. CBS 132003]